MLPPEALKSRVQVDGLRRTIREREAVLGEKMREVSGLELARLEITQVPHPAFTTKSFPLTRRQVSRQPTFNK